MEYNESTFLSFITIALDFISYINQFDDVHFMIASEEQKVFLKDIKEKGRFILKMVYEHLDLGNIPFWVDNKMHTFEFCPLNFKFMKLSDINEKFQEISLFYEDSPNISNEEYIYFSKIKDNFIKNRNKITAFPTVFDIPAKDKIEYLRSYHDLLYSFFGRERLQDSSIIRFLLFLDTYRDKENHFTYSLCSPLLLAQIHIIEQELNDYKVTFPLCDKNYFISKIKERFNFNLANDANQMCTTSLDDKNGLVLQPISDNVINMDIDKNIYDPYYEKKYSFPSFTDSDFLQYSNLSSIKKDYKQEGEIKVAIIGNAATSVIENLYERLKIDSVNNNIDRTVVFEVYSDCKMFFSKKYENVIQNNMDGQVLRSKNALNKVVETNDFLFVFDSEKFYSNREEQSSLSERFRHTLLSSRNLYDFCSFKEMLTCLERLILFASTYYINKQTLFGFYKEFNKAFRDFIVESSKNNNTSLFVFLHDNVAYNYNDSRSLVHIDKGSLTHCTNSHYIESKKNGIREYFLTDSVEKKRIDSQKMFFQFSLFDFYRFIFFNDANFVEFLEQNKTFLNTKIILDYSKYPILELNYFNAEIMDDVSLYLLLEQYFIPYFYSNLDIITLIGKFFYNISNNVNDLLFVRLFLTDKEKKYQFIKGQKATLVSDVSTYFAYKWIYYEVTRNFDTSSSITPETERLKYLMADLAETDKLDLNQFYDNIFNSCKRLKYEDSYLAIKFQRKKKE